MGEAARKGHRKKIATDTDQLNGASCFSRTMTANTHMNLDKRNLDAQERIPDSHASMRIRPGVDDNTIHTLFSSGMDPIDERALVVTLETVEFHPVGFGLGGGARLDRGERVGTVDFGFACTEQVQVRSVDELGDDGVSWDAPRRVLCRPHARSGWETKRVHSPRRSLRPPMFASASCS